MAKKDDFPLVAMGTKFARDVVKGRIPAGRYVVLACKRHLDDLAASKARDYPYRFDPKKAEKKLMLAQMLPHTKGKWARQKLRVKVEPWQAFGLMCTFGWLRKKGGMRRFRESYWEVPRKNGKSVIAAAVGLGMLVADGEFGAEVYSGATTEKQALEVFRPARLMMLQSPDLVDLLGVEVNAQSIVIPEDGSRFEPVIGKPGDGASPSCAIVDEYHEHATDELYETMVTGMGAREQGLMFVITTAGSDIEGPCYDKRRQVIEMLEGEVPDPELFGWIWSIDEGDDWTDPKVLAKANPNFGVSVDMEFLESQQRRAVRVARFTNTFKMKHLNVWTNAKTGYFNLDRWQKCADPSLTLDQFAGEDAFLGLDLARKIDMNALARIFTRLDEKGRRHYYSVAPQFWVPEETVQNTDNKRMAERYQAWVTAEKLVSTDGAEVDYREILAEVVEQKDDTPIAGCAIDPSGATGLSHMLMDEGVTPIVVQQNYTSLSDPMKELEAAIMSGRFHHDGNPIMTWCVANVIGKNIAGNDDVVRPIKQGDNNKIDGAVAMIMAISRAMHGPGPQSVLDSLTEDDILVG